MIRVSSMRAILASIGEFFPIGAYSISRGTEGDIILSFDSSESRDYAYDAFREALPGAIVGVSGLGSEAWLDDLSEPAPWLLPSIDGVAIVFAVSGGTAPESSAKPEYRHEAPRTTNVDPAPADPDPDPAPSR